MSQFLGLALFLIVAASFAIHAGAEFPWFIQWFGKLPGDIIIHKKNLTLYVPLASSLIVSAAVSIVLSLFSRK